MLKYDVLGFYSDCKLYHTLNISTRLGNLTDSYLRIWFAMSLTSIAIYETCLLVPA